MDRFGKITLVILFAAVFRYLFHVFYTRQPIITYTNPITRYVYTKPQVIFSPFVQSQTECHRFNRERFPNEYRNPGINQNLFKRFSKYFRPFKQKRYYKKFINKNTYYSTFNQAPPNPPKNQKKNNENLYQDHKKESGKKNMHQNHKEKNSKKETKRNIKRPGNKLPLIYQKNQEINNKEDVKRIGYVVDSNKVVKEDEIKHNNKIKNPSKIDTQKVVNKAPLNPPKIQQKNKKDNQRPAPKPKQKPKHKNKNKKKAAKKKADKKRAKKNKMYRKRRNEV
ncbi:hypothetical protein BB559_001162 [Furculomyces boomerangus]|uniref:Uncharacterized protein n=1 Tax=Furculomyces boomerangus TaxID=61424 RepID=A0A2T9Z2W5_9FUNG|nr:hypothetical protein BB559_001162 [Furculomyces boomerangus]